MYKEPKDKSKFRKELEDLINEHSLEGGSDTPDFILAEYLVGCLENFEKTMEKREKWYGRGTNPVPAGLTSSQQEQENGF
jgi:hypothetical protein